MQNCEAWRGAAEGLEGGLVVVKPNSGVGSRRLQPGSSGALFRHIDKGLKWHHWQQRLCGLRRRGGGVRALGRRATPGTGALCRAATNGRTKR